MNNRIKNILILTILLIFLLMIKLLPVACLFWQATCIYCPACGMTRACHSVMSFKYNILSIPLFLLLIITIIILLYEIIFNKWIYIPFILKKMSNKHVIIVILFYMLLSMIINNLH